MNHKRFSLIIVGALVAITTYPVLVQAQDMNLELMLVGRDPIPPTGSQWHELWPNHCAMWTQGAYEDNGDGEVSVCDGMNLEDASGEISGWHITWAGPTYYISNPADPNDFGYMEPTEPQSGGNPTCETWLEVWPNHGMEWHIDDWMDTNQSGVLDVCDEIIIAGAVYHIDDIGLNIVVEPGPVPTTQSTWGDIKSRYEE